MKNIIGNIESIRAVEDSIRATRKYTEGIFTIIKKHPAKIQGDGFPSKAFTKYYEVYPYAELPTFDDTIGKMLDWLETPAIEVKFYYDYRIDKATIYVRHRELSILRKTIPNLSKAVNSIIPYINKEAIDVRISQVSEVRARNTSSGRY